jgi:hypothetical protein
VIRAALFIAWMVVGSSAMGAGLAPFALITGPEPPAPWHVVGLPLQQKPYTRFTVVEIGGVRALRLDADHSYGNLVHPFPGNVPWQFLSWRWRVDVPNDHANLRLTGGDDTAAEVCVMFDLPMDSVPFLEQQFVRLARLRSKDLLPTATVCYVWDAHFAPGTTLDNAFTRRMRMIVLRGQGTPLMSWTRERRDVRADFLALFGDEAQEVPPIIGVSVSADADNTHTRTLSFIADLMLEP